MSNFNDESDWVFDADTELEAGLTVNDRGTSLSVTDDYAEDTLEVAALETGGSTIVTIDASERASELYIVGNTQSNVITLGSGGGTVDGTGGSDRIYLRDGSDVIVYGVGQGRDSIYNYDGDGGDAVVITGATSLSASDFYNQGDGKIFLELGGETLSFVDSSSFLSVQSGEEIVTVDVTDFIFSANRQSVTLGADYADSDFDASNYSRVQTINAVENSEELNLVGNANNNVISIGTGGGSLSGGSGGNNKLYGNEGNDVFIWTAGQGSKDTIFNYDGDTDVVSLVGVETLDGSNFIPSGGGNVFVEIGNETLALNGYNTEADLRFVFGEDGEFVYNPKGISFRAGRRSVTLTSDYSADTFDGTNFSQLQTIDASQNENTIELLGNAQDNVIRIGTGGGTLDGGAGSDKLYGNEDQDVFVHTVGAGRDTFYNYNGDDDEVQLFGRTEELTEQNFLNTGNGNVLLDLGNDTIVFSGASGEIKINYGTEDEPLDFTFDPNGMVFDSSRQNITLTSDYDENEFNAEDYNRLQNINAAQVEAALDIIGNANDNVIRAGTGGGSLDGGAGSDKLYGGNGSDYYSYTVGSGSDTIYNYGSDDEIYIYGVDGELTQASFVPTGENVILIDLGNDTLTVVNGNGEIVVHYGDEDAEEEITYDASGATLTPDRRVLSIDDSYAQEELLASDYASDIETIDARQRSNALDIYGNANDNAISVGSGSGIIDGGSGNDKLYGGRGSNVFSHTVGAGFDTIYNYDSTNDARADRIMIHGLDELDASAIELASGGSVLINLGVDTLTIVDPEGVINVVNENDEELASFDASGLTLVNNKFLRVDSDFKGDSVDAANYGSELETISAVDYKRSTGLGILGNNNDNDLRAGSGGFTLDGGRGEDKLYGDNAYRYADTFLVSLGSGDKRIYNYASTLEGGEDAVAIVGDAGDISEENFNEIGTTTTLSIGSDNIVFVNPKGSITIVDEGGSELFTYGMTDGLTLSADKKLLVVTDDYTDSVLDAADYNSWIETINARNYSSELEIIGNANNNYILGGTGGGTLDGGSGDDYLSGNTGVDVFRFAAGQGNDSVYNYDGSDEDNPDLIMISGVDSLDRSAIRQLGDDNMEIVLGSNTLTLVKPRGAVTVVGDDGEPLITFDTTGSTVSTDSRTLVIGPNYNDTIVDAANYSSLVATIDARGFPDPLMIVGNSNANAIYAGAGGSTIDGAGYNDNLYGNDGADEFRYRAGEGDDHIYNFNSTTEGAEDRIRLLGVTSIDKSNFRDTSNGKTVIRIGTNELTLEDPVGAISVYGGEPPEDGDEEEPLLVYGKNLQSGVTYNFNKTKLTIARTAALEDEEDRFFDVSEYSNNLKHIDATYYGEEITLKGDSKSNSLIAGTGGSSMDGGGGFDKLIGGAGADTFVYHTGEGNDYIYNFDASDEEAFDVVQIFGDVGNLRRSNFRDSGKNTILQIGSNQLTFVNPKGQITILDSEGEELITYASTLESGVSYNDNKSELTISRDAELEDPLIDMATLSNNLRIINGTDYEGELHLVGNEKPNVLRAGSGGSTLDGRTGSDRLYGGNGEDHFIVSVGGGNDVIYGYNGDQGDVLVLGGSNVLSKSNFQDSGNNTFLSIGNEKIMLDNPKGAIKVVDEDGEEIITYGLSLPNGVYYEANKTRLVIGASAELSDEENTFDVANYGNNLRDINAAAYTGENGVILIGDDKTNELRAGTGGSSMNGGRGNDKLYGGSGADTFAYTAGEGNDYIYNYNGAQEDIVQLFGVTDLDRSNFRDSSGNIVLRIGSNYLTFSNAQGPIILADAEGNTIETTYDEALPSGLTYNSTKTKLTIGNVDELEDPTVDMATLSNNLKDVDASRYEYPINLLGNDKPNELRAGSGGSSLDGRAGNDKLYGGAGADTYVVSVGGGRDYIFNYDGTQDDIIQLYGIDTIDNTNFKDNGNNVVLDTGNERVMINNPVGMITVVLGDSSDSVSYGSNLADGVSYNSNKSVLTIGYGADLDEESNVFDMATLANNLRNIDASAYEGSVVMRGNKKMNELRAGSGGSSLDGGLGNDKIYGGADADTFVYHVGEGNDHIHNYDGEDVDVIQILDADDYILDNISFRDSGRNVIVSVGNNRLTLVNPQNQIILVDENDETITTYNDPMPDGVSYNSTKTVLTVGSNADLGDENLLDMETLAASLKDIDASAYSGEILLKGNSKMNDLKAGSAGSSLDGGGGNDKLYGGDGVDTFAYTAGEGNDYIYNYNGTQEDVVQVYGVSNLDETAFKDSGANVVITIGTNRINLIDPVGQITVVDENGTPLATHNVNLATGVSMNASKTKLIIGADAELEDVEVRAEDYGDRLLDIDASQYPNEIALIGNANANELSAGAGGSTLDGGEGNDKLYGGNSADVFVYSEGSGNKTIYNYNSTDESAADVVRLDGVSSVEQSDFRDNGRNTILTIGSNRLTFVNPKGIISVTDESGENVIATYGALLPDGVSYNSSKTKLTIGSNAELDDESKVFDMATLSSNLREINGASYGGDLVLIGNDKSNELRAGSGGSSMNGGLGADKLYGGDGADTFVYDEDSGNDKIYNLGEGDVIQLNDVSEVAKSDFRESGRNTVLTVGTNRLTIVNPSKPITVVDANGEELITYGKELPSGVSYNSSKTKLTISDGAELEESVINVEDYINNLRDINASGYGGTVELNGDDKSNELRASKGGSTLHGGGGNDKLYGGDGADTFRFSSGSDVIYNFNPEQDSISLVNGEVTSARINGSNIVYTVGDSGTLTLKNAARYGLLSINFVEGESEQLSTEDYWFTQSDQANDELQSILSIENISVDLPDGFKEFMSATALTLGESGIESGKSKSEFGIGARRK